MGGWVMVDPDDVIHRHPIKRSLKGIFVTSSGRLDRTSLWGFLLSVLLRYILRYKGDIFVRQKSLHMYPTSTFYITYGKLWSDVHRTIGRQLVSPPPPPQHLHYFSDKIFSLVFCHKFVQTKSQIHVKITSRARQGSVKIMALLSER